MKTEFDSSKDCFRITFNSYWSAVPKTLEPLKEATPIKDHEAIVTIEGYNQKKLNLSFRKDAKVWAEENLFRYNSSDVINVS